MNRRLLSLLVAAALLSATALGLLLIVGAPGGSTSRERTDRYRGSEPPTGMRLPGFELHDVLSGRTVRSGDLAGRVVLTTFLDTDCTEQCPIIAGEIGRAVRRMAPELRSHLTALAISVDPKLDTRKSVERFLRDHRALGELTYLSGSVAELRPVWRGFHVVSAYETGDADTHSADVRVFDPEGAWVSTLHAGVDLSAANLARDAATASDSRK